jgi:hypothetical protein
MSYPLCVDEPRLQAKQQQLAAKEFSAGVMAFYWAVNKRCNELAHHNVFLSGPGGQGARQRRRTAQQRHCLLRKFYIACRLKPAAEGLKARRKPTKIKGLVQICRRLDAHLLFTGSPLTVLLLSRLAQGTTRGLGSVRVSPANSSSTPTSTCAAPAALTPQQPRQTATVSWCCCRLPTSSNALVTQTMPH